MSAVIGVDPGPVTGAFRIYVEDFRIEYGFIQGDPGSSLMTINAWIDYYDPVALVAEDFVIGKATAKTSDRKAGQATRHVLERLRPYTTAVRSAAEVKQWATDERLKAAGILDKLQGMRHARDAARHALFHAVRSGTLQDPLSKKWKYRVL